MDFMQFGCVQSFSPCLPVGQNAASPGSPNKQMREASNSAAACHPSFTIYATGHDRKSWLHSCPLPRAALPCVTAGRQVLACMEAAEANAPDA